MLAMNYRNFRKYRNILKVVLLEKEPDFLERCNSGERAEIEQRVEDFRFFSHYPLPIYSLSTEGEAGV